MLSQGCLAAPPSGRYAEPLFEDITVRRGIPFGAAVDYRGDTVTLRLDFYEPAGDAPGLQRPLILWAHGGYFLAGIRSEMASICLAFARMGYATATIDYRLGMVDPTSSRRMREAVWRAMQDGRASVRFFHRHAETYGIDTARIFFGGYSAGAVTALQMAYLDRPEEIPPDIDTLRLGGLEGRSGNPGYPSRPAAVLSLAGALGDSRWMEGAGDVPVASVHGTADPVVPFGRGPILSPTNGSPLLQVHGSGVLHARADSLELPNALRAIQNGGHGAPTQSMSATVAFLRDFLLPQVREDVPVSQSRHSLEVPGPRPLREGDWRVRVDALGRQFEVDGSDLEGWREWRQLLLPHRE